MGVKIKAKATKGKTTTTKATRLSKAGVLRTMEANRARMAAGEISLGTCRSLNSNLTRRARLAGVNI